MKFNRLNKALDWFISITFILFTGVLMINLLKLSNIENLIRGIVLVALIGILVFLFLFKKKKKRFCWILMSILIVVYSLLNFTFYKIYNSLNNITNMIDTKGICLVTSLENVKELKNITSDDIAVINKEMDKQFLEIAKEVLDENRIDNKLVLYDDYFEIISALLSNEIKYAFLPENYNDIYNAANSEKESQKLNFNILYSEQREVKKDDVVEVKDFGKPFTILLMGTDVLLDSYNADTLLLLTVNTETTKVTMLSIPRDTYTTIACTGGKHKINSSGWYGDSCVVKTVAKYLGVNIDYYAKINFLGIVDMVDKLGGIEVDVPYAFCEQNSKREFGEHMIYVDAGKQTLNGEQALALSRNRHYWNGICSSKYTTDGIRSDITRGQNQQLVIKSILSKLMSVRDLNTFYDILDTVGDNMTTNMSKETIFSFYNVGKKW